MADDNPFDSGAENNPFADPSAGASEEHLPAMYDPFAGDTQGSYGAETGAAENAGEPAADQKKKKKKKKKKDYGDESAWPAEQSQALTGAAATVTAAAAAAGGSIREQNLMAREQNLLRKEAELAERERRLASLFKDKNWPFKCWAITYHSIADEIPPEDQKMISRFYVTVRLVWATLFLNWLTTFVYKFDADGDASYILWSSVYLLLGVPGSWFLWYRAIYSAARDDSSGQWGFFFFNFLLHTCFCIVMACGIPSTAGMGVITFASEMSDHKTTGFFALATAVLWILTALMSVFLLRRAYVMWRSRGGEAKAKKALAKQAAKQKAGVV